MKSEKQSMSDAIYATPGQEIVAEYRKMFGDDQIKTIHITPRYVDEVTAFIKGIEEAHQAAANSQLVFK